MFHSPRRGAAFAPRCGGNGEQELTARNMCAQHNSLWLMRNEPHARRQDQFRRMMVAKTGIAGGGPWAQYLPRSAITDDSTGPACSAATAAATTGRSGAGPGTFGSPSGVSSHKQTLEWPRPGSSPGFDGTLGASQPQSHAPAGQQQQRTGPAEFEPDWAGTDQLNGPIICAKMRAADFIYTPVIQPPLPPCYSTTCTRIEKPRPRGNAPAAVCPRPATTTIA